ncbi:hypothetical protein Btru_017949 [Bulinus truncatus]|nr:hypothetical protein Btru_017949 [Bulinus truncatus]
MWLVLSMAQNNGRQSKNITTAEVAEFGLEDQEAEVMFNTFDKDKNGKLSIWEFQQFCVCMGEHAQEIVTKFKELDKDGSGQLDPDEARAGLRAIRTATGRELAEKEVEFFVQTTCGENGVLDLEFNSDLALRCELVEVSALFVLCIKLLWDTRNSSPGKLFLSNFIMNCNICM